MITTTIKHLDNYYDHDKQSLKSNRDDNIRKRYVLEYCDNQAKFERLGYLPEHGGLKIDDVYHSIIFEETDSDKWETFDGIAIEMYIYYLFNPKILDVKLYEEIYKGDELLSERWFEFPATFRHEFVKHISMDIMERARKKAEALRKERFAERIH